MRGGGREGKRREFCKLPRGAPRTPPGKPPLGLPYHRTPLPWPLGGSLGRAEPKLGIPRAFSCGPCLSPGMSPAPKGNPGEGRESAHLTLPSLSQG